MTTKPESLKQPDGDRVVIESSALLGCVFAGQKYRKAAFGNSTLTVMCVDNGEAVFTYRWYNDPKYPLKAIVVPLTEISAPDWILLPNAAGVPCGPQAAPVGTPRADQ